MTDIERSIFQRGIDEGYETFTQKVADARDMTLEDVKKVAGGRVYSGEKALELGLVDEIGSFYDAIDIAVEAASIENDDYSIVFYPKEKPFIEELIEKMSTKMKVFLFGDANSTLSKQAKSLKELQSMKGLQAKMAGGIEVR